VGILRGLLKTLLTQTVELAIEKRVGFWNLNVGIAKSPTRTLKTQTNHIYCAIWAYVKLEKLKFMT
jgi:hypothetical protein